MHITPQNARARKRDHYFGHYICTSMNDTEAHTELATAILADTSRIVIPALIVAPTHVNDFTLELLQLISSYFAITSHFRICMPLVGGISISCTYHSHTLNVCDTRRCSRRDSGSRAAITLLYV